MSNLETFNEKVSETDWNIDFGIQKYTKLYLAMLQWGYVEIRWVHVHGTSIAECFGERKDSFEGAYFFFQVKYLISMTEI